MNVLIVIVCLHFTQSTSKVNLRSVKI